jgi:hypothetical protein
VRGARNDSARPTGQNATARRSIDDGSPLSIPGYPRAHGGPRAWPGAMRRLVSATPPAITVIRRAVRPPIVRSTRLSLAEPLTTREQAGSISRPALPVVHAATQAPPPLAVTTERGPARPTLPLPPLVHAGGQARRRGGGWEQPAASRPLDTVAEVTPRERDARARPAARPPTTPQPDIRAIADRVHDVLVERLRQERRARGM